MTTVYEATNDSAKGELAAGNVVSLLDVTIMIMPIDESPGVGVTFGIASPFGPGPAWLTESLEKIRHLCEEAAADFSEDSVDVMRTTLRRRGGTTMTGSSTFEDAVSYANQEYRDEIANGDFASGKSQDLSIADLRKMGILPMQ